MAAFAINITADDADIHGIIDGPVWEDGCRHLTDPNDIYVCSFECLAHKKLEVKKYDLYVIRDDHFEGHSLCIRYGNEPQEYISPGGLPTFLAVAARHHHEPYPTAARILTDFGLFSWQPKPPKK